jgi:hypothetical protein
VSTSGFSSGQKNIIIIIIIKCYAGKPYTIQTSSHLQASRGCINCQWTQLPRQIFLIFLPTSPPYLTYVWATPNCGTYLPTPEVPSPSPLGFGTHPWWRVFSPLRFRSRSLCHCILSNEDVFLSTRTFDLDSEIPSVLALSSLRKSSSTAAFRHQISKSGIRRWLLDMLCRKAARHLKTGPWPQKVGLVSITNVFWGKGFTQIARCEHHWLATNCKSRYSRRTGGFQILLTVINDINKHYLCNLMRTIIQINMW